MNFRGVIVGAVFALATLLAGGQAFAVTTEFTFSYSGNGGLASGSGTLFGDDLGGGNYLLTSGTGTSTEAGALTLESAGTYINTMAPSADVISDNVLCPTCTPVLTGNGIVFLGAGLDPSSQFFNIWGNGDGSYSYFNNWTSTFPYNTFNLDSFTVALAPVPVPAGVTLMAGALALLVALAWWGRRRPRAAARFA